MKMIGNHIGERVWSACWLDCGWPVHNFSLFLIDVSFFATCF